MNRCREGGGQKDQKVLPEIAKLLSRYFFLLPSSLSLFFKGTTKRHCDMTTTAYELAFARSAHAHRKQASIAYRRAGAASPNIFRFHRSKIGLLPSFLSFPPFWQGCRLARASPSLRPRIPTLPISPRGQAGLVLPCCACIKRGEEEGGSNK